jgi:hypothetical protein
MATTTATDKAETGHAESRLGSETPDFDEKVGLRTVDAGLDATQVIYEVDPAEERKILRKIDYRLIPLLR